MRFQKAFTIIELLVVIAILGILASIVLANFRGTREEAKLTAMEQAASQLDRGLGAHIVGRWDLDGNANDSSGYENNGNVVGGSPTTDRRGRSNRAYSFNGTNSQYIQVSDKMALDTFTVAVWVYPTVEGGGARAVVSNTRDCCGTYRGYAIETSYISNNAQVKIWKSDGSGTVSAGGANVDINQWNFLVGTFDGSSLKFYKNGALVGTNDSYSGTLGIPSNNLRIGSHGWGCCFFGGKVDDVRIYSRALTAQEIQQYYARTAPTYQLVRSLHKFN